MSVLTYPKQFNHQSDLTWDCSKGFDRPLFESSMCRRTECRGYRCPTPERGRLKRPGAGGWHFEQMANVPVRGPGKPHGVHNAIVGGSRNPIAGT